MHKFTRDILKVGTSFFQSLDFSINNFTRVLCIRHVQSHFSVRLKIKRDKEHFSIIYYFTSLKKPAAKTHRFKTYSEFVPSVKACPESPCGFLKTFKDKFEKVMSM